MLCGGTPGLPLFRPWGTVTYARVWSIDLMDFRVAALPLGTRVNSRTRDLENGPATSTFVFRPPAV